MQASVVDVEQIVPSLSIFRRLSSDLADARQRQMDAWIRRGPTPVRNFVRVTTARRRARICQCVRAASDRSPTAADADEQRATGRGECWAARRHVVYSRWAAFRRRSISPNAGQNRGLQTSSATAVQQQKNGVKFGAHERAGELRDTIVLWTSTSADAVYVYYAKMRLRVLDRDHRISCNQYNAKCMPHAHGCRHSRATDMH